MGVRQSGAGGWGGDVGGDDVLSCAVGDWVVIDQLDGREGATEGDVICHVLRTGHTQAYI